MISWKLLSNIEIMNLCWSYSCQRLYDYFFGGLVLLSYFCEINGGEFMGLDKNTLKYLEKQAQKKASELAHEAQEKLTDHYVSLIDWFYVDYQPIAYDRTFGLYDSYKKFYKNSHGTIIYGGVEVTPEKMADYDYKRRQPITASTLLDKFIYNPSGTWHGGDMHGGYGKPASFGIYKEMHKYHEQLKDEYRKRCSI